MSVSNLIDRLRGDIDDIQFLKASEWKKQSHDHKVIGCYPVYTPVELVHASGMLPVLIAGGGSRQGMHQSGSTLQGFVCSIGRSTSGLQASGNLDFLDGMLFPSICEISRALSGVMERNAPGKAFLYIHFPQNLDSAFSVEYVKTELERIKSALEKLSGRKITGKDITNSFHIYNRRRELLDELDKIRARHPDRLSASQFYILQLAGMQIAPEAHIAILEEALKSIEPNPSYKKPRLKAVMVGAFCERIPISVVEAFEADGVAILGDDMLLGQRWWTAPLPIEGDPMQVLAEHYCTKSIVTSVVHRKDPRAICNAALNMVKDRGADGLIVAAAKFCQPALSDVSCLVKACEEEGIPYIRLEFEESMNVFAPVRLQIEALLEARSQLPFAGTEKKGGI